MALRKPLVLNAGQIQQLQAADTLDAPQSGGDTIILTNGNAGAVVIGAPVYASGNDTFDKAQANAASTKNVLGLAVAASTANGATGPVMTSGVLPASTAQWDAVTGLSGGLTKDVKYFLDPANAGKIVAVGPSTVGQYVVELGIGLSTTEMLVRLKPDILL